ncbi:MAG: right-handed parallel beta-helix repeat-containing protein [Bacteroidota bacterium]
MKFARLKYFFLLYIAFFTFDSHAQLSGSYTIGGASPDYINLSSAVADLHAQGVGGTVLFNIRNGTYSEQITFTTWAGMSAVNSVTFQSESSDSSLVILHHPGGINNTPLIIDGADYLVFNKIGFEAYALGPYNRCAILKNDANDISFKNCNFYGSYDADNEEENLVSIEYGIGTLFEHCRFENGYRAISLLDNYFTRSNHMIVRNCEFYNPKNVGIYGQFIGSITVEHNTLSSNDYYSPYGIYLDDVTGLIKIIANLIEFNTMSPNSSTKGIFLTDSNPLTGSLIANNMVFLEGNSYVDGIGSYGTGNGMMNIDIAYNTVRLRGGSGLNCRAITSHGTGCRILNNIFVSENSSSIAGISGDSIDFNNFYTADGVDWSSTLSNIGSTNFSMSPSFLSTSDLHVAQSLLSDQGSPMSTVLIDIDGEPRDPLNPDIGADETPVLLLDASLRKMISPLTDTSYCGSVDSVLVVLTNFGSTVLTSTNVSLYLNGVLINTLNWTGSLARNESDTLNLGIISCQPAVSYELLIVSSSPNGGIDEYTFNDSITIHDFHVGLSGTYTLGGLNPDFVSFRALETALSKGGLCGPVIINVRNGSYHDYLYLKDISGCSAENTLTIQGESGDSSLVTIWDEYPSGVEFTLRLENVAYITFKHLTIRNEGGIPHDLVILLRVHDITFESIILYGNYCNCSGDTRKLMYGIQVDSNFIMNKIRGFNAIESIVLFGNPTPGIESSNFVLTNSQLGYFYIKLFSNIQMKNNTIGGGFSQFNGCGRMEIEKNKFREAVAFWTCGDFENPSYFRNNTVWAWETGGASHTWDWGISLYDAYNIQFYHNTVKTKQWAGIFHHQGSNIQVHNNLFHQENANVNPYYCYSWSAAGLTSDHNVFWSDSGQDPLQNIQTLFGQDMNSLVINPIFSSHLDSLYWPSNPLIDNLGVTNWSVVDDLYGSPRGSHGDPGAIEKYVAPILNLGVNDTICSGVSFGTIDKGYSYLWNTGATTPQIIPDSSGIYILSASNSLGSDTDTITIVIVQSPAVSLIDSIYLCIGDSVSLSYQDFGLTYSWSNGDTDTLTVFSGTQTATLSVSNSAGCVASDSTSILEYPEIQINLLQTLEICQGDSVFVFNQYESNEGIYYDSLQAVNGCDSIVSIVLSHHAELPIQVLTTFELCFGDSALIFNKYQSTPGTYYDSLQTIYGCDSIVSIVVNDHAELPIQFLSTFELCFSDSALIFNQYQSTPGTYYDSLQTIYGCDSIVSIVVNDHAELPVHVLTTVELCFGDSALIFNQYQSTPWIYFDTLQTMYGCDSIVRQELIIHPIPNLVIDDFAQDTVCLNDGLMMLPNASPNGGVYSGTGLTGNQFDPFIAGMGTHFIHYTYSNINGCSTEDSVSIVVDGCLGIEDLNQHSINLSPNPFEDFAVLDFGHAFQGELQIKIYNLLGQVIHLQAVVNESKVFIESRELGKGTFILVVYDAREATVCSFRLVVE